MINSSNVTCMSEEERPGSGCCSTHRPCCSRACSLGSACPSKQLAALIKAESSAPPSAPWHQSGLAMHKAPLQTLLMLVMQTQTVLYGHERSLVPPTPSPADCPAQCRCGSACLLQHFKFDNPKVRRWCRCESIMYNQHLSWSRSVLAAET